MQKNVLFLIAHDVGRRFGCYGGQAITPTIDRLAQESILFENHFCNCPLCGPSRANIFTGLRPTTTGRFNMDPFFVPYRNTHQGFQSLSEIFKNNGYYSASIGFVLHDHDDPGYSTPEWYPSFKNEQDGLIGKLPASLTYHWVKKESFQLMETRLQAVVDKGMVDPETMLPMPAFEKEARSKSVDNALMRQARGPMTECADVEDEAYYDGLVSRKAVEFLQDYDREEPFFLAVGFESTHTPYCIPEKYWKMYDRDSLRLPPYRRDPLGSPEWASGDSEPAQYYTTTGYSLPWKADREQSLEMLHGHLASVSYVDEQIRKILTVLEKRGMRDNTVIIVVTDHGYHDAEHGYWGKHNMWDVSFRVPFVLHVPGMEKEKRISSLTEHVDIYPTLCELCGIEIPETVEGISLMPLIGGSCEKLHDAVFANRKPMWHDRVQGYALGWTVRTERYRLTTYLDSEGKEVYAELFDYEQDSDETTNYIADPTLRAVEEERRRVLLEQRQRAERAAGV